MHNPVLVTPPASRPVELDDAKLHLKVEDNDEDTLIQALIDGAVSHLDGWNGILGRCICDQTWRLDFDGFCRRMRLPAGPIIDIVTVTWRNSEGQISTVNDSEYIVQGDELVFRSDFDLPSDLIEEDPVSVTWRAGYPDRDGASTVPAALKVAILLMVGHWYANRETVAEGGLAEVPFAANVLIAPFRRMNV